MAPWLVAGVPTSTCPGAEARPRHTWGQLCHPHFADRGTLPTAQGLTSWTGQAGGQLVGPQHSVVTTVIRGPEGTPCWSEPRHCCLWLRQQLGSGSGTRLDRPPGDSSSRLSLCRLPARRDRVSGWSSWRRLVVSLSSRVLWSQQVSISIGHSGAQTHNSQLDGSCFSFGVKTKCLCSDG